MVTWEVMDVSVMKQAAAWELERNQKLIISSHLLCNHYPSFLSTCCIGIILWTTILYTTTYCLLGELGAAGLRAPPKCVADPQPDLGNTSEGKASITADIYHLSMRYSCDLTRS